MSAIKYHKRDFWGTENLKYATPHFRMRKVARVIRAAVARRAPGARGLDLLDVGCGPGALASLLPPGVRYHGIDIALAEPAPHLREADIVTTPIGFDGRKFDLVVAQGLFEYMGTVHLRKLAEIAEVLADGGTFICTYQNFAHRRKSVYWPYSNVIAPAEFRAGLARHFRIERAFPTAYNWNQSHPNRSWLRLPQERATLNVPLVGQMFAVDYCYVCAPLDRSR